jgi:ferredoxin, 2Fe-2S
MPKITFVQHDATVEEVQVNSGTSIMQAAVEHAINGIVAECGGNCSCGTCHVYVDATWVEKLNAPEALEAALVEHVLEWRPNSRLSCQIVMKDELDGIVVHLPESQY